MTWVIPWAWAHSPAWHKASSLVQWLAASNSIHILAPLPELGQGRNIQSGEKDFSPLESPPRLGPSETQSHCMIPSLVGLYRSGDGG